MRCFLCKKIVLGFAGQDALVDTAIMPAGHAMIDAGVYGEMHLRCLQDSGWGNEWARLLLARQTAHSGTVSVGEYGDCYAFHNRNLSSIEIVSQVGECWSFSRRDLAAMRSLGSDWRLQDSILGNLRDQDFAASLDDVRSHLASSGAYSLARFLEHAALVETLLYPAAMDDGVITASLDQRRLWTNEKLVVTIRYGEFVPSRVRKILIDCHRLISS